MQTASQFPHLEPVIKCAVCKTHSRPLYVPWHQHAIGCSVRAAGLALQTSVETFSRVLDVNLVAPYALSCLVAGHMREGGARSIVNVASVMGLRSIAQIADAAYVA